MTPTENPQTNDPGAHDAPGIAGRALFVASFFGAFCSYFGFKAVAFFLLRGSPDAICSAPPSKLQQLELAACNSDYLFASVFGFFAAALLFYMLATGSAKSIIFILCSVFAAVCSIPVIQDAIYFILDFVLGNISRIFGQLAAAPSCGDMTNLGLGAMTEFFYRGQCSLAGLCSWFFAAYCAILLLRFFVDSAVALRATEEDALNHSSCIASTRNGMSRGVEEEKKP